MTKEEVLYELESISKMNDPERAHALADDLLLYYINDYEIKTAYDLIGKWYA